MASAAASQRPAPLLRKGTSALGRVPKRATTGSYCDHSGWGSKQGSIIKNWKRRYFVLKGVELIYFAECSPSGKGLDEKGRLNVAAVEFTPDFHDAVVVVGTLKNQKMVVQFEGGDVACKEWMQKIKTAIQNHALTSSGNPASAQPRHRALPRGGGGAVVTMEGWLFKEGQNFKTWKKRYMTLAGRVLQYAEAQGEPPKGEVRVQSVNINKSRKFALDIYSDNNRILRIAGATFETIEAWDHALARTLRRAPCFGESFSDQPAPFLGMDSLNDTDCDGWLYMCGHRSLSWKKRYFTLKQHVLQYADHPGENSKGEGSVIDLKLGFKHCQLEIKLDDGKWLSVAMDSDDDFDKWLRALCELLDRSPALLERVTAQAPSSRFMFNMPSTMSTAMRSSDVRSSLGSRGSDLKPAESIVRKKGWLRKEGQRMKSWKRRYFVLEGSRLHYYENIGMKTLKGGGDVKFVEVSEKQANGLSIHFESGRVLHVAGDSAQDIRAWMESLQGGGNQATALSSSTFGAPGSSSFNETGSLPRSSTMDSSGSDSAAVADAVHAASFGQGWLLKQGSNFKTWKQRYFVLHERTLSYSKGVGEQSLGSSLVEHVAFSDVRPFALDVKLSSGRVMTLAASVDEEFMVWCRAFKACFELRLRAGSVFPAQAAQGDVVRTQSDDDDDDYEDNSDDDDEDIAILDDNGETDNEMPRGPALLKKMHSEMDEIEDVDGLSITDDPSVRELTAHFNTDMVVCSGWLRKQGGHIKSWKERFFTLYGTTMRYFKTENGPFIGGATIVHVLIVHTRKHSFEMTLESGRKMAVLAESEAEAERWISALRRAIATAREEKATAAAADAAVAAPPVRPKITRAMGKSSLLQTRSASSASSQSDASAEAADPGPQVYAV